MKKRRPIVAPGWMSMLVQMRTLWEMRWGKRRRPRSQERVSEPVQDHRVHAGVGQVDLQTVAGRGVAVEDAAHVLPDTSPRPWCVIGTQYGIRRHDLVPIAVEPRPDS
jgi:hypothetical protein